MEELCVRIGPGLDLAERESELDILPGLPSQRCLNICLKNTESQGPDYIEDFTEQNGKEDVPFYREGS